MKLKAFSRGIAALFVLVFTAMLGLTSLAFEAQADVNQMLGTAGDNDLVRAVLHTAVLLHPVADRLLQIHRTAISSFPQ